MTTDRSPHTHRTRVNKRVKKMRKQARSHRRSQAGWARRRNGPARRFGRFLHRGHGLALALAVAFAVMAVFGTPGDTPDLYGHLRNAATARPCRRGEYRPRNTDGADAASYSRYSSDNQDSSSIAQQQRKCRDGADANGHVMVPSYEFGDEAVSGTRRDRAGLLAMMEAAKQGLFRVLYFESLSRLARDHVISAQMLRTLVYAYGIRVISVSEGVDSDKEGWELMAIFRSWMHAEYLKQLRSAVLRGQEECVLNDFSVGDWCLGYASEPVPGSESGRRGRNAKPRRKYVVREEHARWVRQIFEWFVVDRKDISWIIKELTRSGAPKDHRATTTAWTRAGVLTVLGNMKYVGIWPWGLKTNDPDPNTAQVRQVDVPVEQLLEFRRERPLLRIVSDELFFRAQGLLDANVDRVMKHRKKDGKLGGSTVDLGNPRHLLQGVVKCGACGATFKVGGANGRYLRCGGYHTGACSVKTMLKRDRAERQILERIGAVILGSEPWKAAVVEDARASWERHDRQRPDELRDKRARIAANEVRKKRLLDMVEEGTADADVRQRLAERTRENEELHREVRRLQAAGEGKAEPPSLEKVESQLAAVHTILTSAEAAAAGVALRNLVGTIRMDEVVPEAGKRKFLKGTFTVSAPLAIPSTGTALAGGTIEIEFRDPPPWAGVADRTKELFDRGMPHDEIARALGCIESWPVKALKYWHQVRGLPLPPDGRSVKGRLAPTAERLRLLDRVHDLWVQNLPIGEIGERTELCRDTVTAYVREWHEGRGLPVPDGRPRRKEISRLARPGNSDPEKPAS